MVFHYYVTTSHCPPFILNVIWYLINSIKIWTKINWKYHFVERCFGLVWLIVDQAPKICTYTYIQSFGCFIPLNCLKFEYTKNLPFPFIVCKFKLNHFSRIPFNYVQCSFVRSFFIFDCGMDFCVYCYCYVALSDWTDK